MVVVSSLPEEAAASACRWASRARASLSCFAFSFFLSFFSFLMPPSSLCFFSFFSDLSLDFFCFSSSAAMVADVVTVISWRKGVQLVWYGVV